MVNEHKVGLSEGYFYNNYVSKNKEFRRNMISSCLKFFEKRFYEYILKIVPHNDPNNYEEIIIKYTQIINEKK